MLEKRESGERRGCAPAKGEVPLGPTKAHWLKRMLVTAVIEMG